MKPVMASFGRRRSRSVKKRRTISDRRDAKRRTATAKRGRCLSFRTRMARRHRSRRGSRRSSRRGSRRSSHRRHRFGGAGNGMGDMGPGFPGATSFQNGYAPYFGGREPFVNASEFWYPNVSTGAANLVPSNQPTNYQSPKMLRPYVKFGKKKLCSSCG